MDTTTILQNARPAPLISQGRLKELLRYEPETGKFYCIKSASPRRNGPGVGDVLGHLDGGGHVQFALDKKTYMAHRLAWLYVYGKWPEGQIDHINGLRSDNRISNLRDVPRYINMQNRKAPTAINKSGFLGVHKMQGCNRWRSQIVIDGKKKHIGLFATPELAHEAYLSMKRKFHEGNTL